MKMKKLLFILTLFCVVCCAPEAPKEIPQWGNHNQTEKDKTDTVTPPTPTPPEPVDTLEYSADLSISSIAADFCGIAVKYSINTTVAKGDEYGLFYEGAYYPAPAEAAEGETVMQVIPMPKQSSQASVNVFWTSGGKTVYSEASNVDVPAQPGAITLSWEKLSLGLPSAIEVYHTSSQVDGKNFQAWYAVADISAVDVKIKVPSSAATLENQAAGDSKTLILVNGGYFYNGKHTGHAVVNGSQLNPVPSVRGSLRTTSPEYNVMYYVTRGTFALDNSGQPSVTWAGTDNQNSTHYFDIPLASVCGEARYTQVNAGFPAAELPLKPTNAVGAGPVLIYDGQIPFNFTETEKGDEYYRNNFEIMPYDIFGPGSLADRTAVGILEDGRLLLFCCDGRIKSSTGLDLLQLSRVLLGLGCKYALNLDGGGSTAFWVSGSGRLNSLEKNMNGDTENRPVVSTIGFYSK